MGNVMKDLFLLTENWATSLTQPMLENVSNFLRAVQYLVLQNFNVFYNVAVPF